MAVHSPLTRNELLEMAVLDAVGLLDEYEAALYTRAFLNAPTLVKYEVIELQARIASDESLLPSDEPPAELRQRVLEFVASAIEKEPSLSGPLATIGRPGRRQQDLLPATGEPVEPHRSVVAGSISRQFWRAATFVLCAAVIAVAYVHTQAIQQQHELTRWFFHENTSAQIEQAIGPTFKDYLLDPATTYIVLTPASAPDGARAVLCMREGGRQAVLVFDGLPTNESYELRIRDGDGVVHHVATFASFQRLGGYEVGIPRHVALGDHARWEIALHGDVLLASA